MSTSVFVGCTALSPLGHHPHVRCSQQATVTNGPTARIPVEDSRASSHPFFDGWFMRLTDITTGFTLSVVLGLYWSVFRRPWWSRRFRSAKNWRNSSRQEHYLCISARDPRSGKSEPLHSAHLFPQPHQTSLDFGEVPLPMSSPDIPLHESKEWAGPITGSGSLIYKSEEHGKLELHPSKVSCHLRGLGGNQQPWSLDLEAPIGLQPKRWVPEGWVGKFGRFGVLPCRYMILTTASPARYSLKAPGGLASAQKGEGDSAPNFNVQGDAQLHVEANYGECFPDGWVYAQGHGRGDSEGVRLVLTGGRFEIGPAKPVTWILCLELPGMEPIHFRTTDLDRCDVKRLSFDEKIVEVEFRRRRWVPRRGQRETSVRLCLTAPESSFGKNGGVYVPTPLGFDRSPGALESFAASGSIEVKHTDKQAPSYFKLDDIVLEFGGSFQRQNAT